jgi:hypothetical protein
MPRLGIGNPPPMAAPMAAGAAVAAEPVEEKTQFDVILASFGEKKIDVIKIVRQLTNLGLLPAKWGGDTEYVEVSALTKQGLPDLIDTLAGIENLAVDRPVLVHVLTQKGRGHDEACNDPCKFHGLSPAADADGKGKPLHERQTDESRMR